MRNLQDFHDHFGETPIFRTRVRLNSLAVKHLLNIEVVVVGHDREEHIMHPLKLIDVEEGYKNIIPI